MWTKYRYTYIDIHNPAQHNSSFYPKYYELADKNTFAYLFYVWKSAGKKKLNESGFQDHCKQQQHNCTKRNVRTNEFQLERKEKKKCESFPRTFTLLHILCWNAMDIRCENMRSGCVLLLLLLFHFHPFAFPSFYFILNQRNKLFSLHIIVAHTGTLDYVFVFVDEGKK